MFSMLVLVRLVISVCINLVIHVRSNENLSRSLAKPFVEVEESFMIHLRCTRTRTYNKPFRKSDSPIDGLGCNAADKTSIWVIVFSFPLHWFTSYMLAKEWLLLSIYWHCLVFWFPWSVILCCCLVMVRASHHFQSQTHDSCKKRCLTVILCFRSRQSRSIYRNFLYSMFN